MEKYDIIFLPNKIVYDKYKTNFFAKGVLYPFCVLFYLTFEFDKNANSIGEIFYIFGSYLSYTILFGDNSEFAFLGVNFG